LIERSLTRTTGRPWLRARRRVAYAFGDESERTPRVLLRWRGVADVSEEESAAGTDP
jgi:hypothetical protein